MKILILTESYFPFAGELSDFSNKLASALIHTGNKVSVICPSIDHQNTVQDHNGISIYRVGPFNFSQRTFPRQAIENAIAEISPDIIHLQNHFYLAQDALDYARRFIIPTVGTITPSMFQDTNWNEYVNDFKYMDFVTASTQDEATVFSEAGFAKNIFVMPRMENYEQLYKQAVR